MVHQSNVIFDFFFSSSHLTALVVLMFSIALLIFMS